MEVLRIGVIGVRVSVITLQEQEHGTELDLAPTRHLSVMEGENETLSKAIMFWDLCDKKILKLEEKINH